MHCVFAYKRTFHRKEGSVQKSDSSRFDDQVKSMNLKQLQHSQDSIGTLDSTEKQENLTSIRKSRTLRYNAQLDTSTRNIPKTHFTTVDGGKWKTIKDEIAALEKAKQNAEEIQMSLESFPMTGP